MKAMVVVVEELGGITGGDRNPSRERSRLQHRNTAYSRRESTIQLFSYKATTG